MTGILVVLPMIVALLLWAHWYAEGESGPLPKFVVLGLIVLAIRWQFFGGPVVAGLVLQVSLALGLLFWNRWHDAGGR
jgi:hypothetical protein